jgi:hypothetical protein
MRARSLWLVPVVLAAGCGGDPGASRVPAAPATERPYRPPADGRLTESQVQAYLAAIRALPARAGSSSPDGSRASPEKADDGAGSLHGSAEEYRWVRQKVLESEMRLDERAAVRREVEIDRTAAAALRQAASASTDPPTRESLARQIADLERRAADREREGRKPGDPAETANDALVSRYRRQIAGAGLAAPRR